MARRSRLSDKYQKKSTQTLVLSVLGIIAVLFLLFRYGIPLIGDASFLFGRATSTPKNNQIKQNQQNNYVPVPDLNLIPKATKDQKIKVTGTSLSGLKVALYLNGSKDNETDVADDGTFEFSVTLSEGDNILKSKAFNDKNESDFSDSVTVVYKKSGPELSIESPSDNADLRGQNPIEVKGKTDPDVIVVVNDFQAVSSSNGGYSYFLTLKGGGNDIKVVAMDAAGNKTEKTIHVNYSQ